MAAAGLPFFKAVSAARAYRPASILPPHPLPEVPQAMDVPEDLPDGCFLPLLFCFCCGFFVWSDCWPFKSKVCPHPAKGSSREQKSIRQKRFFFTRPPSSDFAAKHDAT